MSFTPSTKAELSTAVSEWMSSRSAANATYGHISSWDTSQITDMSHLFCGYSYGGSSSYWADYYSDCNNAYRTFNDDISSWDTAAVTTFESMFRHAYSFNQDLDSWDVAAVTGQGSFQGFYQMFQGASDFDQELCWNTGAANIEDMFEDSPGSLSGTCQPSPAPTVTMSPTITSYPTAPPTPTPRPTNTRPVPAPTAEPTEFVESNYGTALAIGVPLVFVLMTCCLYRYYNFLKKRSESRVAEPAREVALSEAEMAEPQKQEDKGPESPDTTTTTTTRKASLVL